MREMREKWHTMRAERVHPVGEMEEKCARLSAMWRDFFEDPATREAYRERGIEIADKVHTETFDKEEKDGSLSIVRWVQIDARSDSVMTRGQAEEIHMDICDELLSEIWDIRDELDVMQHPDFVQAGEVLPLKFTLRVLL